MLLEELQITFCKKGYRTEVAFTRVRLKKSFLIARSCDRDHLIPSSIIESIPDTSYFVRYTSILSLIV